MNAAGTPEPTTTQHRPGCTRPGWTVEQSRSIQTVAIAYCTECDAIELRTGRTNQ